MKDLGQSFVDLGYDLLGLNNIVYLDIDPIPACENCTTGCHERCSTCQKGCANGPKT